MGFGLTVACRVDPADPRAVAPVHPIVTAAPPRRWVADVQGTKDRRGRACPVPFPDRVVVTGAGDHKGRPLGFCHAIQRIADLLHASFHPGAGSRTCREQRDRRGRACPVPVPGRSGYVRHGRPQGSPLRVLAVQRVADLFHGGLTRAIGEKGTSLNCFDSQTVSLDPVGGVAVKYASYVPRQYVSLPPLKSGSAIESEAEPEGFFLNRIADLRKTLDDQGCDSH